MIDFSRFNSIFALTSYFSSDKKCKQAIAESRWEDGLVCPYCGGHDCAKRTDGRFRCRTCRRNFSCLVGTIFENTNLPLIKWFIAMYLISSHKKGVSSHQLSRDIDVTLTTAWYTLHTLIGQFVNKGAKVVTDELSSYNGLEGMGYTHAVVNHGKEEYVNGELFTNSVEGFWGHFKRCIFGIYHFVSPKYLQRYIDEMVFRWNTRRSSESKRFEAMFQRSIGTVRWVDIPLMAA